MLVEITKLAGETGLRQPGTRYIAPDKLAQKWIESGYAIEVKEEKTTFKTKEEKFKGTVKETKKRATKKK